MKEIYLLNSGDSIKKIQYELNMHDVELATDKIFGYKYAITNKGNDDIIIVKNYLPNFVHKITKEDNYLDILARGFKLNCNNDLKEGDVVILEKPRSIRYIVSPIETLDDIAMKYGIDKEDIKINNNLNGEKLFVGQILWI